MKVSEPIAAAARQLKDETGIEWTPAVLLSYLNYAVREIIDAKPEAYPITTVMALAAGTKQAIPAGNKYLIDVTRNMGITGDVPGQTIRGIGTQVLDSVLPDWHYFPPSEVVQHSVFDPRTPREFFVFPPQPADVQQKVEIIVSGYPDKVTDKGGDFPLDDSYEIPAIDYIIYRALAEETTIPNALAKSKDFYGKFAAGMGIESKSRAKSEQPAAGN